MERSVEDVRVIQAARKCYRPFYEAVENYGEQFVASLTKPFHVFEDHAGNLKPIQPEEFHKLVVESSHKVSGMYHRERRAKLKEMLEDFMAEKARQADAAHAAWMARPARFDLSAESLTREVQ